MKSNLLLVIIFGLLISSCKKEYKVFEPVNDYVKLNVGNYWVYKVQMFNSTRIDSVLIARDTLIRGETYFVTEGHDFYGNWEILSVLRDSSNYIIDELGGIHFTTEIFNGTINQRHVIGNGNDSIVSITYRMQNASDVKVPAGSFTNILNYQGEMFSFLEPPSSNIKFDNFYYSKNVGLVKSIQNFASGNEPIIKELIRYRVN